MPEEPFRFSAAAEAVEFEGNFYEDCADGTRLVTATRNVTRRSWLVLAVLLGSILMSLLLLTGFRTLYVFLALLWIAFLCINLYVRLWRARRHSREQGRPIAWYSKGWLDEAGYCAMTTLGQSHAAWKFFDHYEITDRAIGLYPHEADICCCLIGREQFASPQDWQRATDLVVRMMRSTPN